MQSAAEMSLYRISLKQFYFVAALLNMITFSCVENNVYRILCTELSKLLIQKTVSLTELVLCWRPAACIPSFTMRVCCVLKSCGSVDVPLALACPL